MKDDVTFRLIKKSSKHHCEVCIDNINLIETKIKVLSGTLAYRCISCTLRSRGMMELFTGGMFKEPYKRLVKKHKDLFVMEEL